MKIKQSFANLLIVSLLGVLAACTSDVKQASCSNQEDFDPIFRQCVPKALGTSIQITSSFPDLSYSINATSTIGTTHSVSVSDPFNQGYNVQWFRFEVGSAPVLVANTQESYEIIPSSLAPGAYTLEVLVKDFDNIRVLDKRTWSIVVNAQTPPSFSNPDPSIPSINFEITDPIANFQIRVDNPDQLAGHRLDFFLDGVIRSSPSIPSNVNEISLSYGFNPALEPVGNHVLQAFLKDATNNTIDTFTWSIFINNPSLPDFSQALPSISNTITVIDGVSMSAGGFFITDIGGNLINTDICVEVDDYLGTANNPPNSGTTVQFFSLNTPAGSKFPIANAVPFTASGTPGQRCLQSILGTYNIILANSQIGEVKFIAAELRDNLTGELADTRTWELSVRPKNEAPLISVNQPPSSIVTQFTQDAAATNFSFNITDSYSNISPGNIDHEQFETTFLMNDFILNGALVNPPTSIAYPDCTHAKNSAQTIAQKFSCDFTFPSWNSNGPVAPGPRVLTASVLDTAVAAWGGSDLPSNTISWSVNIIESQTAPEIMGFTLQDPATLVPLTVINEGDSVRVSFTVRDAERDNFNYTISRCTVASGGCTPLIANELVTRTNGDLDIVVSIVDTTNQGIITGANSGIVNYEISVTDIPDSVGGLTSAVNPLTSVAPITVNNINPAPIVDGTTAAPNLLSTQLIMTGFPFTFSPGVINDASITDGEVLEYQWQVSNDSGANWRDITGANEASLTWTPPSNNSGTTLQIRVCVGDNGFGNDVSACIANLIWTNLETMSNLTSNITTGSSTLNNEFDSWFDKDTRRLYSVHQFSDGPNQALKVNITDYSIAGTPTFQEFTLLVSDDLEAQASDIQVEDLSIIGATDPNNSAIKSLYISYLALIDASPGVNKQLRVRRVDISDSLRVSFNYAGVSRFNQLGSTCFDQTTDTMTNQTLITIPSVAGCIIGDAIEINGVSFVVTSSTSVNSISGVDLISALDAAITAAATSPDARLSSVGGAPFHTLILPNQIQIDHNQLKRDYIDDTRSSLSLGKIMHDTQNWFIPSIDSSTGSKLLFYSGQLTGQLQNMAAGTNDACSSSPHCLLTPVTGPSSDSLVEFDADISIPSLSFLPAVYVAGRDVTNTVNVYRFSPSSLGIIGTDKISDIFSGENIQDIQITASKPNNPNLFVAGKNNGESQNPLSVVRVPVTPILPASCSGCDVQVNINDTGTNIAKQLDDYSIISSPLPGEALIATVSAASPSSGKLVVGRISGDPLTVQSNLSPILPAGQNLNNIPGRKLFALTDIINPDATLSGIEFGTYVPATSLSNRNALFISYFNTVNLNNPESAIININSEATMGQNVEANDLGTPLLFMRPYISN